MAMFAAPRFTIADLDRLPDDGNRYELLGGQLLVTPAPGPHHQVVLARLITRLAGYLGPDGPAIFVTPGVIQLEDHTQLEPDLLVVPAGLMRTRRRGAGSRAGGWPSKSQAAIRKSMIGTSNGMPTSGSEFARSGAWTSWTNRSIGPYRAT